MVVFLEGAVEMGVVAAAAGVGEFSDWAMNDHDSDSAPSGSGQEWLGLTLGTLQFIYFSFQMKLRAIFNLPT